MKLEELFESYLGGKMSESDKGIFEKLLKENPEYQSQLNTFKRKHNTGTETAPPDLATKKTILKTWIIPAAIACVLVLSGYLLWITLGMSPGEKLYAKHYEPLPNQVPKSAYGELAADIKTQAFQAYDAGDFEKAATLFQQVESQPDSEYILLYHGICQLELGRPEKAIPLLNLVNGETAIAPKEVASWYEALGYFKMNMLDKGTQSLKVTAAKPNPYQAQAKTILESLK